MESDTPGSFSHLKFEKWMVFRIGSEYFAVSIHKLKEVIRYIKTIPLPGMPGFVEGMIHLRGQVVCVLNVEKHLGFPKGDGSSKRSIMILDFESRHFGLVVDEVLGVREFQEKEYEPIPEEVSLIDRKFLLAIVKSDECLIVLLDIIKMFSKDELLRLHHLPITPTEEVHQ